VIRAGRRFILRTFVAAAPALVAAAALGLVALGTKRLAAQPASAPTRREMPIVGTPGTFDRLVSVPAGPARSLVVSDVASVLAAAHPTVLKSTEVKPHVSLYRLNSDGLPDGTPPQSITLPLPDGAGEMRNFAMAMAAHPKLPLLYVWQDMVVPEPAKPLPKAEAAAAEEKLLTDGFEHLHVFDISSVEPKHVQSFATGPGYARGARYGAIAFDLEAKRLFVPNLRRKGPTGDAAASVGFLHLDDVGRIVDDSEGEVETAGSEGAKKGKDDGAIRAAARKAYLAQIRSGNVLPRNTRNATAISYTFGGFPAGLGFVPVSDTVTVVAGALGIVTWDESNRRARFNNIGFYPMVGAGYLYRLSLHPKLPVIFVSGLNSGWIYRMEHVDGFPTLLPQRGVLAGVTALASPPVTVGDRPLVALGGQEALYLVEIDAAGYFTGKRTDVPLKNPSVSALWYSPRFDRLYVTEEAAKK
jgi:hypothetical protein